ncbi:MAG: hypothetical protein ACYS76_09740 [Planctomycetota bacterium]|jgi:hypothetical protein
MKIKLKRSEIIRTYNIFKTALERGGEQDYKFNYAIIKNKQKLEKKMIDISIKLKLFELDRLDLCEKYCDRNEKGEPIFVKSPDRTGKMVDAYTGLEKNKEYRKESDKQIKEKEDYEKEKIEIEIYSIPQKILPNKMVGVFQEALLPFIAEELSSKNNEIKIN